MAFYQDKSGNIQKVDAAITPELYKEATDNNLTVAQLLNRKFADADLSIGTAAAQIYASEGLALTGKNPFGLRNVTTAEVLDGKSGFSASNVKDNGTPFGTASRTLFPAALVDMVEAAIVKDYTTDGQMFDRMVAQELAIANEAFEQPVITYGTRGGPEQIAAQRVAQFSEPPTIMRFGTSDRIRKLPTFGIMLEFSQQALRSTTLDMVAMIVNRQMMVEKDGRVYSYINDLFNGNGDLVTGAVSAVTTTSLDSAATGGVVTHKSWVKFLARNRKYRKITHVIADIDTYLKVEGRTGRPGSNNYDPTLARIDPQAVAMNVGFGNNVQWFIVDSAADGGPVPANTVYAIDAAQAITRVSNTSANYTAAETFALRRSEAMVMHWSEAVYRTAGDSELKPFDVLTIA
jgi:hypothetical protein